MVVPADNNCIKNTVKGKVWKMLHLENTDSQRICSLARLVINAFCPVSR